MSDKKETFEDWYANTEWILPEELAWKHQQAKLDKKDERIKELENHKVYYDRLFAKSVVIPTEEYSNLITRIKELEDENKELNKMYEEIREIYGVEQLKSTNEIIKIIDKLLSSDLENMRTLEGRVKWYEKSKSTLTKLKEYQNKYLEEK